METSTKLLQKLKANNLDLFLSVPCKLTDKLIRLLEQDNEIIHTPVTREEEGVGIAAGAFLVGKKPCLVLQNSGIGNSVNAICSLLNYYQIPLVMVVSHRGMVGEKIEAQKPMGQATKSVLDSIDVKHYEITDINDLHIVDEAINYSHNENKSVAILLPHAFWNSEMNTTKINNGEMNNAL